MSRPQTNVTYEMELIGEEGEFRVEFSISFDSELYDGDKESTDAMAINMKMQEIKEFYASENILMLSCLIEREKVLLN